MFEQLEKTRENYYELEKKLADPELLTKMDEWKKVNREYNELKPIVMALEEYRSNEQRIQENKEMLDIAEEDDMIDLLNEEIKDSQSKLEKLEDKITFLLIPKDPNDHKDVFVEIRLEQVVMRQDFLQVNYIECMKCTHLSLGIKQNF